ncbi:baseplate hub [Halorubrum tailed virus 29]|uniref:Baseplate hub n=1 Tax=Halorubrum tailed virus 29 TaxID=2878010 RepID=A0AAE8Y0R9_9CAUD|nr:baseplate hub [Halorubrum tailed virus 29]UBF23346.1 baseplate hub [Halorubrum tailed virus 29]
MLFDAAFDSPFTAATPPRTEFVVFRDGTEEDAVYDVSPLVDTANPFGDYCVFKLDDRGGQKFEQYPRGTRIDAEIRSAEGIVDRFTGYVVERRENEQAGADALEVEAYSFDQFLRRNTVTNDQRGNTITQALSDIIQTDTPVSYVAGNVDVGDDQELTRSYQGEPVENVLRDFAFKSNNEEFGVNDDLEFFFRPRETEHIDRGIDNTQWFRYDIPELGKEAINEVEVWFNDGEESVVVDDGTDKLDLQDNLGLPSPGTQRAELNRPLVTDITDAEDIGRKYLQFRNSTLSGTVTTFGLYDAEPGDTIDITIDSRGIDSEFVIAGVEYRWGVDETILTIIERRGDVDDILTDLNDSVQRVEMEGANRDAPSNRITTTNATAIVDVTVDADGNTPDANRFVNDGRRAVRDTWTGDAAPDITTLVVGDDGTGLSRSNTTLKNQTNSASVTQSLPDATSVFFDASVTQTGVQEIGLETADGRLITRAVFASPVDLDGTVSVTLDVSNDASVSRGVITTDGQTAVRDVLADNSPALPNAYAYGDDSTAVSESDTALGNELVEVSLDDVLIQSANTTTEFDAITDIDTATLPLTVSNGEIAAQQSSFTVEAEDYDREVGDSLGADDTAYSGSGNTTAIVYSTNDVYREWDFTLPYDLPEGALELYNRNEGDNSGGTVPAVEWSIDGTIIGQTNNLLSLDWKEVFSLTGTTAPALEAGTHTIRAENVLNGSGGARIVDVVAPLDGRFNYTFDNSVSGDTLDGPELFPDQQVFEFATAETRRDVTEASFDLTANDVSNNFYVELANDGSTFTRVNNSQTGSVTFASPDRGVDARLSLSRFGTASTTPATGTQGQSVSSWALNANPDAVLTDDIGEALSRAVVPPGTITGDTVREAGLKSDSTLLTRHEIAEFVVESGQRIASAETTQFTGDN